MEAAGKIRRCTPTLVSSWVQSGENGFFREKLWRSMSEKPLLRRASLGRIRKLQHVVIFKDTASVEQVLKTLANHRIVSAPVVSEEEPSSPHPTWPMNKAPPSVAGFIDIKDVINTFLKEISGCGILETPSMLKKMRALESKGSEFSKRTIKELNLIGGDGSFLPRSEENQLSLYELAGTALLNPQKRGLHGQSLPEVVHRVAVFDPDSRIVNIISQSDVVRYLLENEATLGEAKNQDVLSLGFGLKPVVSVPPELSAIEALKVMNEHRIGALAVVNSAGKIIGNFSAADMRTITPEHFGSLALPVGEFLALEHGTEYAGFALPHSEEISGSQAHQFAVDRQSRGRPTTPGSDVGQELVVCRPSSTLLEVMRLLVGNRIHRVFIVDDELKPVGVLTCTDILRKLVDLENKK